MKNDLFLLNREQMNKLLEMIPSIGSIHDQRSFVLGNEEIVSFDFELLQAQVNIYVKSTTTDHWRINSTNTNLRLLKTEEVVKNLTSHPFPEKNESN